MERKENPTTTDALNHEVRPEHFPVREAMNKWCEEAPDGATRSCIVIHCEFEANGEGSASSHISGNGQHLLQSITACMNAMTPDNPVGQVLRSAAIRSLTETGAIVPAGAPTEAQAQDQPTDETHNNAEDE